MVTKDSGVPLVATAAPSTTELITAPSIATLSLAIAVEKEDEPLRPVLAYDKGKGVMRPNKLKRL
jgi:hypothetical protein